MKKGLILLVLLVFLGLAWTALAQAESFAAKGFWSNFPEGVLGCEIKMILREGGDKKPFRANRVTRKGNEIVVLEKRVLPSLKAAQNQAVAWGFVRVWKAPMEKGGKNQTKVILIKK